MHALHPMKPVFIEIHTVDQKAGIPLFLAAYVAPDSELTVEAFGRIKAEFFVDLHLASHVITLTVSGHLLDTAPISESGYHEFKKLCLHEVYLIYSNFLPPS